MLEYRADFAQDKIRLYEDIVALYICQDNPAEALTYAERAKSRALTRPIGLSARSTD